MSQELTESRVPSIFVTVLFQLFAFTVFFISLLHGIQELVLLSLFIMLLFGGARLWCWLSLKRVYCSLRSSRKRGFPGDNIALQAEISNAKFLPVWMQLKIPAHHSLFSDYHDNTLTEECSLPWYGHFDREWELTARRRGCFQVGPPSVEAGDLFGFFRQEKIFPCTHELIVYPRPVNLNSYHAPLQELFGLPGDRSPITDPAYPVATRDYRYGRPARHIHWKASARHNRLQEKVFEPSHQRKLLLLVDVELFYHQEEREAFEQALEVVAAIGMELDRTGSPYSFLSNGTLTGGTEAELPGGSGPLQLSSFLETLARLEMKPEEEMPELLLKKIKTGTGWGCFYFAAGPDKSCNGAANILNNFRIPTRHILYKADGSTVEHQRIYLLDELHGETAGFAKTKAEGNITKGGK